MSEQQVDLLAPLRELLSVPERWTKRAAARGKSGRLVYAAGRAAVCWCLIGGMVRTETYTAAMEEIRRRVGRRGEIYGVTDFNDDDDTTHADIVELLREPFYG